MVSGTSSVKGNVVYTAVFTEHIRSYTITFKNWDGTILNPDDEPYEYGSMPFIPTPTREGHDFIGWDKSVDLVEGDAIYTAQYRINYYTITFIGYKDFEGTDEQKIEYTLAYGSPLTPPSE